MSERKWHPYVDRGKPGSLRYQGGQMLAVKDPERVQVRIMKLQEVRRHNSLEPQLQETNRILLRWGEGGGSGLKNPEADIRETHYDPLPPDLQERVDDMVGDSPWETLMRKWYRTSLDRKALAKELRVSRTQLYADWRAALWYYRGRFEANRIYG
jgi:hypothetical protein